MTRTAHVVLMYSVNMYLLGWNEASSRCRRYHPQLIIVAVPFILIVLVAWPVWCLM